MDHLSLAMLKEGTQLEPEASASPCSSPPCTPQHRWPLTYIWLGWKRHFAWVYQQSFSPATYPEWLLKWSLIKPKFELHHIEILFFHLKDTAYSPEARGSCELLAIQVRTTQVRLGWKKINHWETKQFPISQRFFLQSNTQTMYEEFTSKNLN